MESKAIVNKVTGGRYDMLNPVKEDVSLKDIAFTLANMAHFGGRTKEFLSVAEHSVICLELNRRLGKIFKDEKYLMMHDANEAYLMDLVKPLKNIPAIREIWEKLEDKWDDVIFEVMGVYNWGRDKERKEYKLFKEIDVLAQCLEFRILYPEENVLEFNGSRVRATLMQQLCDGRFDDLVKCMKPIEARNKFISSWGGLFC